MNLEGFYKIDYISYAKVCNLSNVSEVMRRYSALLRNRQKNNRSCPMLSFV